jgi:hypothetical protein
MMYWWVPASRDKGTPSRCRSSLCWARLSWRCFRTPCYRPGGDRHTCKSDFRRASSLSGCSFSQRHCSWAWPFGARGRFRRDQGHVGGLRPSSCLNSSSTQESMCPLAESDSFSIASSGRARICVDIGRSEIGCTLSCDPSPNARPTAGRTSPIPPDG